MRNRAQNKLRARKRYRRMRNNPMFKRRQRMYRMNPNRYRRLASVFWPIPFCSASMGYGYVVGVDDDEVFYVLERDPDLVQVLFHQDFLDTAVFFEDEDINQFFELMDTEMEVPLVARAISDAMVQAIENEDRPEAA